VTGTEFVADLMRTGLLHGIGVGTSVGEVDRVLRVEFVDDADGDNWLRRDYGLVELNFTGGPDWVVTGGGLALHRLPALPEIGEEWARDMGVTFPAFIRWADVVEALSEFGDAPELESSVQGEFRAYRAAATRVTAVVVDNEDERDDWPGHGDLWAVNVG
jgi:hypothetical protein